MTASSSRSGPDAASARAAAVSVTVGARPRRWFASQTSRRLAFGYLLLAPAVLYVMLLVGAPFLFSLFLALSDASVALAAGDDALARALMTDERLDHVLVRGTPASVGRVLAGHARRIRPDSVGFALLADDMTRAIDGAAEAFATVTSEVAA